MDIRARCHENSYQFWDWKNWPTRTGLLQGRPAFVITNVKRGACRHQSADCARSPKIRREVEGRVPIDIAGVNAVADIATALRERLVEGIPCIGPVAACIDGQKARVSFACS